MQQITIGYFSYLFLLYNFVHMSDIYWNLLIVFGVINFRSDLSDEPTESDSGSDYSDQKRSSSR